MSLRAAFEGQARACVALGSPFMGQLMGLLARAWPKGSALDQAFAAFDGDIGPGGASLPLRIAGGLHALVLTGRDAELAAVYPPNAASDDALQAAVLAAFRRHEAFLLDWTTSAPQTNEVRRSVVLIAAGHWIAGRFGLPLVTSELGASAGLNLNWDRFGMRANGQVFGPEDAALMLAPDWSGPVPEPAQVAIDERAGVDLNPLDPGDPDHALRLCAFLWPDQPHRMELTRAAMAVQTIPVVQDDAIDWLARRLEVQRPGCVHLIYHTIAWQYFPQVKQTEGTHLIESAGARAHADAPLVWLRMENDGSPGGAAVTLRLWPGDEHVVLGRADFHGRWVDWAGA